MVVVTPHVIVAALACLSSLALAVAGLAVGRPGWIKRGFALGMFSFAGQSFASMILLAGIEEPSSQALWLQIREATRLITPLAWILFVGALTRHHSAPLPGPWRAGLAAGALVAMALAGTALMRAAVLIPQGIAPFEAGALSSVGTFSAAFQLVLTVGVLAGLEACLRSSQGRTRRRTKFVVLGLGGIFLVSFYLLSQAVLFRVLTATDLKIATTTLLIGNIVLAVGLARTRSADMELAVSRTLVYRSVIIGVLGAYLLTVGGIGWLLNYLRIPEHTFWITVGVFVSAIVLAAVLLSEEARWRLKRFIAVHVYRSKYDYREHWIAFTRRLGTLLTLEDLCPQLLEAVTQAVDSNAAVLYLREASGQRYYLAGVFDVRDAPASVSATDRLLTTLVARQEPLVLEAPVEWDEGPLVNLFPEGSVAVPLAWRGTLTGFMLVGPERTGVPYTPEDLQFMATMGQQATGSIITARLSEDLARTREFDAFARIASFVMHDLKNMVSGLSLLTQNAAKYLDDPEFQKDAVLTLSRTVERMQRLMARLSSRTDPVVLQPDRVDLAQIVGEALEGTPLPDSVRLARDLKPVGPILGDSEGLARVAQNLIRNAIQAMDRDDAGVLTVTLKEEGGAAVLAVTDTGCGMSEEFVRESLFVPFRTTRPGGWGIGLYQVKEIVERHQGAVSVQSREKAGTTFEVRLPLMSI
jgi:putative PEP-CTERM system histidine kinase